MRKIHALLVGIDDYPAPIPRLRGCVNDIKEMEEFLTARIDSAGRPIQEALAIKVLSNEEATRDAVIRSFREHLGQAGPEDVALFCYSGHGSQEQAPQEFWHIEPDHLDETLVCYDSRMEGSWDLADKEIAKLIGEVAADGAHVVVILDCCHSGSGTRNSARAETLVRRLETDLRLRPSGSFIFDLQDLTSTVVSRDIVARPSGWGVSGRHVLLAACRDDEEAKEYQGGGANRGAFSYFLGKTLRSIGRDSTYRDLFSRASALVKCQVQRQSPQLEATVAEDLLRPFLGGAIRPKPGYFVASAHGSQWSIDAGRMDGIPVPADDDTGTLALFEFTAADDHLRDPSKALAKAKITRVFGATSRISITEGHLDAASAPFKAVVMHLPTPRLKVKLDGDIQGCDFTRKALSASLFVREAAEDEVADYRVLARRDQYLITKPDDERPLIEQIDGYTGPAAQLAVERLEHIERWKTTAELDNPNSSIAPAELQVEVLQDGNLLTGSEIRLEYIRGDGEEWLNPEITIRLKNTGQRPLYVGLLDLPQTFGVFPMLKHVGCQNLDKDQEILANDGEPIAVTVPDEFWQRGVTELKDIVKIIVSTTSFDVRRMEQPDLGVPRNRAVQLGSIDGLRGVEELGTLERLMEQVQTRHAGQQPAQKIDDWRTLQFSFTVVRPLSTQSLQPGRGVTLTDGVTIEPHPTLSIGEVRLNSMPLALRGTAAAPPLPRLLYDDPQIVQPFEFTPVRALGGGLNVLELRGVNDPRLVTEASPLVVKISRRLAPDESVLPIASDGEFYLPLGWAEPDGDQTRVVLDRLPQPDANGIRSLGGALRIYFLKVISHATGGEFQYPLLAVAEINDDFTVRYEPNPAVVRDRVAMADRIAIFVHGIIGDTRDMAASLKRASIADRYDLILTFDYENLNTPVSETARELKRRLEQAGIIPNCGKQIDIVAHSMGGLVSRWFIEQDGGHRVVRQLVMLGTPNGGSPWPTIQHWALVTLTLGLNGLTGIPWPARMLPRLVKASGYDITLKDMQADSPLLTELAAASDPEIPYVLIAGDTSISPSAKETNDGRPSAVARLIERMSPRKFLHVAVNPLFFNAPNDIAVAISSMIHVPMGRRFELKTLTVACDHLNYFTHPDALAALSETLMNSPKLPELPPAGSGSSSIPSQIIPPSVQSVEPPFSAETSPGIDASGSASSKAETKPSLKDHLADLAVQFLQADTVLRVSAVWFVVWVWLTLVGLTISLTKELDAGRDLIGLGSLIAVFPTTLVWLRLIGLTKLTLSVLQLMLRGLFLERPPEVGGRALKKELGEPLTDLLTITGGWATAFIYSWVVILIAKAIGALVSGGLMISRFGPFGY